MITCRQQLHGDINVLRLKGEDFQAVKLWREHGGACDMNFEALTMIDPMRVIDEEDAAKNHLESSKIRKREQSKSGRGLRMEVAR